MTPTSPSSSQPPSQDSGGRERPRVATPTTPSAAPTTSTTTSTSIGDGIPELEQLAQQSRKVIRGFFYPSSSSSTAAAAAAAANHYTSTTATSAAAAASSRTDYASSGPAGFASSSSSPNRRTKSISGTTRTASGQCSADGGDELKSNSNNNSNLRVHTNPQEAEENRLFVEQFWKYYDDILILSIFTQIGILFRLAAAGWFSYFDGTFREDSALFVNLPLNCLSTFLMGCLASGQDVMSIVETRFSPTRMRAHDGEDGGSSGGGGVRNYDDDDDDDIMMHDYRHGTNASRGSYHGGSPRSPGPIPTIHANTTSATVVPHDAEEYEMRNMTKISPRLERLRRRKRNRIFQTTNHKTKQSDAELRSVQLAALERRIRASPSILLFPVKKSEADLMEHYFADGYRRDRVGTADDDDDHERNFMQQQQQQQRRKHNDHDSHDENNDDDMHRVELGSPTSPRTPTGTTPNATTTAAPAAAEAAAVDYGTSHDRDLDQILYDVSTVFAGQVREEAQNLSSNLTLLSKVTLADGWDAGTTPEAMCDDLLLGLRAGFCGALSSFSSWNSSMVALIRSGDVQQALVGYMLGIQLPIVSYRFGQHVAVYIFIWRCRQETRSDERRGYGLRVAQYEHSLDIGDSDDDDDDDNNNNHHKKKKNRVRSPKRAGALVSSHDDDDDEDKESELPSVRAVVTALFVLAFVAQITALFFFDDPDDKLLALSLFFSPFGVLMRWRLSRYNVNRPGFPLGTFTCNLLACALSGSLGTLLAGNPGPRERIVLVAFISGFGGTLSSVASFIVEILKGMDPILFRLDGVYYAGCTIFWGFVIGLVSTSSVDWADAVNQSTKVITDP